MVLAQVRGGRYVYDLAEGLQVSAATIFRWKKQDRRTTHVDIATDPDSPYVIDAHANGGDITIDRSRTSGRDTP